MFNDVVLIGDVSKVERKTTQNGLAILSFTVTTTEAYYKNGERIETQDHHRVVAFGQRAEDAHVADGDLAYVNGKLKTRKYADRDGQERYITEVNANRIVDLSKPQVEEPPQVTAPQQYVPTPPAPQRRPQPGWDTPPIDECPF